MQPDKLALDKTGIINETVTSVLAGKHPHNKIPSCATLETYNETPILIPVDITEDVIKLVVRKLLGSLCPGGTDSEALQDVFLKFGEDRKILFISVENFIDWIDNKSPTWAAYHAFMSSRLIAL